MLLKHKMYRLCSLWDAVTVEVNCCVSVIDKKDLLEQITAGIHSIHCRDTFNCTIVVQLNVSLLWFAPIRSRCLFVTSWWYNISFILCPSGNVDSCCMHDILQWWHYYVIITRCVCVCVCTSHPHLCHLLLARQAEVTRIAQLIAEIKSLPLSCHFDWKW